MLEMAITNGARGMGMAASLGSLEVGKKADIVLHDTDLPEWGPVFDAPAQLALERPVQRRAQRLDRRRAGARRAAAPPGSTSTSSSPTRARPAAR